MTIVKYKGKPIVLVSEDAPTNAVGGGNIAGVGVGDKGEPGANTSIVLRRRFAGHDVFEVAPDFFYRCAQGKSRYHKYERYVGNDATGEAIRTYGKEDTKRSIVVKNSKTGGMMFLRYGKKK